MVKVFHVLNIKQIKKSILLSIFFRNLRNKQSVISEFNLQMGELCLKSLQWAVIFIFNGSKQVSIEFGMLSDRRVDLY